jgi:hypothetical protein
MKRDYSRLRAAYMAITAIGCWFALALQLYILIRNASLNGLTIPEVIINYLSFFTVLTNILVALCLTFSLWPSSNAGRFFSLPAVQSGIAVYILVVGLVYSFVLRPLWHPQGFQLLADRLLHDGIPLLYLLFWFLFVPKGVLQWKAAAAWLIYPFVYLIYSLLRGSVTGWYPYPFINAAELSYTRIFLNISMMLGVFLGVGLLLIAVNRSMKR